jgi:hypothetical protein
MHHSTPISTTCTINVATVAGLLPSVVPLTVGTAILRFRAAKGYGCLSTETIADGALPHQPRWRWFNLRQSMESIASLWRRM